MWVDPNLPVQTTIYNGNVRFLGKEAGPPRSTVLGDAIHLAFDTPQSGRVWYTQKAEELLGSIPALVAYHTARNEQIYFGILSVKTQSLLYKYDAHGALLLPDWSAFDAEHPGIRGRIDAFRPSLTSCDEERTLKPYAEKITDMARKGQIENVALIDIEERMEYTSMGSYKHLLGKTLEYDSALASMAGNVFLKEEERMFICEHGDVPPVWPELIRGNLHLTPPKVPKPQEVAEEYNRLKTIVEGHAQQKGIPSSKVQRCPLPDHKMPLFASEAYMLDLKIGANDSHLQGDDIGKPEEEGAHKPPEGRDPTGETARPYSTPSPNDQTSSVPGGDVDLEIQCDLLEKTFADK